MLVFIAVQQRRHPDMGPSNLLSEILENRNCDNDIERLSRRSSKGGRYDCQAHTGEKTPEYKGEPDV
jgi:hypothetical protein